MTNQTFSLVEVYLGLALIGMVCFTFGYSIGLLKARRDHGKDDRDAEKSAIWRCGDRAYHLTRVRILDEVKTP